MNFLEDYAKLESTQQERFQRLVTRLLGGEVITPGSPLQPDPDWRFAERYRDLVDSYLRIGGWGFDLDPTLRLARAVHETGTQRVRFSKLESLVLCTLRLHYHEQMRLAAEEDRCDITVGQLRERLVHAGKPIAQLSTRALAHALRKLARHSLVGVGRGFDADDDAVIEVKPLVEKVLPNDRIQEIAERIKAYVSVRTPASEHGNDGHADLDGIADEPRENGAS
jgi:Domain of unknown function (DUF4194)